MGKYRKLRSEETQIIKKVLSKYQLSIKQLAEFTKTGASYLTQVLHGTRPLRRKYAEQIYKVLREDPSVEFLRDYQEDFRSNPRDGFSGDTDAAWLNLYYAYCKKLETLVSGQYKTRVLILNELEELVNKYSKS